MRPGWRQRYKLQWKSMRWKLQRTLKKRDNTLLAVSKRLFTTDERFEAGRCTLEKMETTESLLQMKSSHQLLEETALGDLKNDSFLIWKHIRMIGRGTGQAEDNRSLTERKRGGRESAHLRAQGNPGRHCKTWPAWTRHCCLEERKKIKRKEWTSSGSVQVQVRPLPKLLWKPCLLRDFWLACFVAYCTLNSLLKVPCSRSRTDGDLNRILWPVSVSKYLCFSFCMAW